MRGRRPLRRVRRERHHRVASVSQRPQNGAHKVPVASARHCFHGQYVGRAKASRRQWRRVARGQCRRGADCSDDEDDDDTMMTGRRHDGDWIRHTPWERFIYGNN